MRPIYWLWAGGLLLKGLGATWDISWHFKTLRETISPPHVVNMVGGVLVALALWHEWRARDERRTGPLLVVLAGVALFLLAMPFDQWWHMRYGLDLTTWSPAHLMLFYGTAVGTFGILLLFITDLGWRGGERSRVAAKPLRERAFLAFFVIVFAGAVLFPLGYNEYTTVAARTLAEAPETMDPELVAYAATVDDPVFHNTPKWLYPVYSVAAAAFLGTLARWWIGPGWGLVALVGIALVRVVANGLLVAAGWPGAALPLQYVGIGLAIEAAWILPAFPAARATAAGIAATAAGYLYFEYPPPVGLAVPLTAESWPLGLACAVAASLAALLLVQHVLPRIQRVPEFDLRDLRARLWAAVTR